MKLYARQPRREEAAPPRALSTAGRWGRVEVLPAVVAAIAGHAAAGCYGITGTAARGLRDGMAELLRRDNLYRGVEVREMGEMLAIDVYVIVLYGVRITEVAHNLKETIRFEVERTVGVPVAEVNVNVQGVHGDSSER